MYEGVRDARPVLAVTVAATLVLALVIFYAGFPAWAASVEPIEISGNNRCGALAAQFGGGQTWIELKKDSRPADGVIGDGTLSVTVSNSDTHQFDWSSNIGLDAVFVKAGNGGFLYLYDPPGPEATADTNLTGSVKSEISHISYCYDLPDVPDEISPTSIVSTTTTIVGATTTIVGATTTIVGATTTIVGATTTIVSTTSPGVSITDPGTSPETLPFTGFEDGAMGLLALVLVASGALALVGTRVFREENDE